MSFSFRTVVSCDFRSPCASLTQYSTLWEVLFGILKILGALRGFSFSFALVRFWRSCCLPARAMICKVNDGRSSGRSL
jgi:hypothetical protein